jgi:aspartate beta-hydroxylase
MTILRTNPSSPRAHYGKARALDRLAEKKQSNSLLQEAIDAYEHVLGLGASVPDQLFLQAAERCINRMRFKGESLLTYQLQVSTAQVSPVLLYE